ncbi:MAG: 50S ribosomal protein L23 [Proteobacteria bacterium]|nr:50S ribosomal protein L23 [Pseudomonadota bacterium]
MKKNNIYDVIVAPIMSEKGVYLRDFGHYVFKVNKNSNKFVIKSAVENIFKVKVKSVNVISKHPKSKIFKGIKGKQSSYKKAIVSLKSGHTIQSMSI